jgi:hypothetical protein
VESRKYTVEETKDIPGEVILTKEYKTLEGKLLPESYRELANDVSVETGISIKADSTYHSFSPTNRVPPIFTKDEANKIKVSIEEKGFKAIVQTNDNGNIVGVAPKELKTKEDPLEEKKQPNTGGGQANIGNRTIDQYEPTQNTPNKQAAFKLSERVVELVKKYAVRFGEDYNPSGTAGVFYPQTDNIFVKARNDVGVAAHEVTHYLDKKIGFTQKVMVKTGTAKNGNPIYDPKTKDIRKELTDIYTKYYPGGKKDHKLEKRVSEGIAVFFERMTTHPVETIKEFPAIHKDFLQQIGRYYDPIMMDFVREARAIVSDYQKLSDLDKIGARVVDAEIMKDKPFLNVQEAAIYHNIDNKYPLEKLAKEGGVHFSANDPSLIARIYDHVPTIIQHNLSDAAFVGIGPWGFGKETYLTMKGNGEIEKKYDFNWHTLVTNVGKNLEDFNSWLVARRVVANYRKLDRLEIEAEQARKTLVENEVAKKNVAQSIEEAGGTSEGVDPDEIIGGLKPDEIEQLKNTIRAYREQQSLIRNDGFDKDIATRAYNDHLDRFKDNAKMFDDLVKADLELAKAAGFVSDRSFNEMIAEEGYATFKRQIENEIIGTGEGVKAGKVTVGRNKVSSLFRYKGSGKDIVSPVYSSMENHQEIFKKSTRQIVYNSVANISGKFPDLFQKTPLKQYREDTGKIVYPQDKDPNIMMAYSNGRRSPYVVNKDLKTLIDNILTPANVPLIEKIFTGGAQFFVKGTTGFFPPFMMTNFLMDQTAAAANTWTKFKPIYTPISELVKVLSNRQSVDAQYAMEYFMLGGERQAYLSFADLNPKEAYDFMHREKNALTIAADFLTAGGDILALPVKATELMTRMSEFIRARKMGYSQLAALELAGRVSTPFHHRGQRGEFHRFMVRSIPYLNAGIQVLAQEARVLKSPKTRNRALFVIAAVTAAMVGSMLAALNASDEQKRLLRGLPPDNLARYVYFPHPDGKTLIKIRVPNEKAIIGTMLNMALIEHFTNAKYTGYEYLRGATGFLPDTLNPVADWKRMMVAWIPQLISPAAQVALNKKFYPTIRDLEPEYMKYLPKEERVFENSSNASKWLGPKIGLSPIQFDALIEGYTGRFSRYVTGREIANPFSEKMYLTATRQVIAFYGERQNNDEEYKQLKNNPDNFTVAQAVNIRSKRNEINYIEKLLKNYRKVTAENKNDPELNALRIKILDEIDSL